MPTLTAARNAVGLTFFLNGLVFASWVSRIPEVRASFDLTNGQLGLVLLAIALGSVLALPTTGAAINAMGTVRIVRHRCRRGDPRDGGRRDRPGRRCCR